MKYDLNGLLQLQFNIKMVSYISNAVSDIFVNIHEILLLMELAYKEIHLKSIPTSIFTLIYKNDRSLHRIF